MKPTKKPVSYRLSENTIKQIIDISKRQKVSQADVISVLVHVYYTNSDFDSIDDLFDVARLS